MSVTMDTSGRMTYYEDYVDDN